MPIRRVYGHKFLKKRSYEYSHPMNDAPVYFSERIRNRSLTQNEGSNCVGVWCSISGGGVVSVVNYPVCVDNYGCQRRSLAVLPINRISSTCPPINDKQTNGSNRCNDTKTARVGLPESRNQWVRTAQSFHYAKNGPTFAFERSERPSMYSQTS